MTIDAESRARLIRANWEAALTQVEQAAREAARDPESIRIVGVSKYVDAEVTGELIAAGCYDLGESRPQSLWSKAETLSDLETVRWHMIGHVQTNKLRRMLRHRPMIHSIDSERLLRAVDQESSRQHCETKVLLEVNISGDEAKTGLSPTGAEQLLNLSDFSNVRIVGLMAMAGRETDSDEALEQFRKVTELRDRLQEETGKRLEELSMGMSGDYRQAIMAGSTMVRIGSALFSGI